MGGTFVLRSYVTIPSYMRGPSLTDISRANRPAELPEVDSMPAGDVDGLPRGDVHDASRYAAGGRGWLLRRFAR